MLLRPKNYAFATRLLSISYKTTFLHCAINGKTGHFQLLQVSHLPLFPRTKKRPDRNSRLDQAGNVI